MMAAMLMEETNDTDVKKRPASKDDGADAANGDAKRAKTGDNHGEQEPVAQQENLVEQEQVPRERWRAHQLAEDYVDLVQSIMKPNNSAQQPHQVMARTRAVSVIELWNPREIALFEAGMYLHGKQFHKVQSIVQTKTTKDVVAFYYIWKKTRHYQDWKQNYDSDESEEEDAQE